MMTEVPTHPLPRDHTGSLFSAYAHTMLTVNHCIALLPPYHNSPIIHVAPNAVTKFIPMYDQNGEVQFHFTS
jgi:hypothetical protein